MSNTNDFTFEPYKYLSYDHMRQKLKHLQASYSSVIKLETAEQTLGIKHRVNCSNGQRC